MATVVLPEPATQVELNVDNLGVNLDGAQVLAHQYVYDAAGDNWDRQRAGVGGTLLVDTELAAAILATDNMANPTVPQVLSNLMLFDGATWDRAPGDAVLGLTVNTELAAAIAAADNMANPTVPQVLGHGMLWDGAFWDRAPGSAADGALVNLGANNDVDTELPAAAALAENVANPTVPAVGSFGMVFDGVTWDRAPGSAADGALVNLGANNDVDTELPAAVALADAAANPTVPAVGSYLNGFNGVTWDRLVSSIAQGLEVDVTRVQGSVAVTNAGLTELAAAINASRMDVNIAASIALDVSAATVTVDSELAAAIAAADGMVNPTVPQVLSHLMGWNGATWDRLVSSIAQGLEVDVTRVQGTVTVDSELPAAILLTDSMVNPTTPPVGSFLMGFDPNGTDWERLRVMEAPNARAGRAVGSQMVGKTEGKVTYRIVFADLAAPGGAGLAGVGVVIEGAAGATVRITKIQIAKPSVAQAPARLRKTSAAHTGGTSTTPTPVPLDSADAVAASVVRLYTAAPTGGGTVVGDVFDADVAVDDVVYETFGSEQNTQGLVLRGVAQALAIQLSAAATLNGYIEWTEE